MGRSRGLIVWTATSGELKRVRFIVQFPGVRRPECQTPKSRSRCGNSPRPVGESPEGGYEARAIGYSICTEADDWEHLKNMMRDAVLCRFEEVKDLSDTPL